MDKENINNIYVGLVIQNNDPEFRGRVKVYIPHLSPTITKAYNTNVDKFFNFVGNNTNPDLTGLLDELKNVLPWAEYAGPIFGGCSSGRYNATTDESTTSDSNAWENGKIVEGTRPTNNYVGNKATPDAFKQTGLHKNLFVNPYTYEYTPSNYSNLARGMFSIPNVGSHVYTFFINGDRNFPVYFASAYGEEDIKRIFTLSQNVKNNATIDYPATYENIKKTKNDPDAKTFRSKSLINSNKHSIEIIDTDLREILKFTHYSGSFKEFNNFATIELATNNDQKMVMGDQFLTVKRNKSEYIKDHNELIIGGDRYTNVGETQKTVVQNIINLHKQIHEFKLLFDVQRAKYGITPNDVSKYQTKVGTHMVCPVCKGLPYNPYDPLLDSNIYNMWLEAPIYSGSCVKIPSTIQPPSTKPSDSGSDFFHRITDPFDDGGKSSTKPLDATEVSQMIVGFLPPCHSWKTPVIQDAPNCLPITHPFTGKIGYYRGMKCPCCNGTTPNPAGIGFSPSTESGLFIPEPKKLPSGQMDQLIITLTPQIVQLEKELGKGGDEIINISMSKIETIGLAMNDMKSFRVDPIGKLKIDGCWVSPQETFENFMPSPHVEYVDVADIPGGDYILTVMNKYKLLVGSKGVNIQTTGPIDIYGTIVNFTGEQINISSKNEVVIDGGERLSLRARKITLLPVEHNAVVVEGQLHVTRNTILEGGIMAEGEIGLLHITAPLEWQETEVGAYEIEPTCEPILCTIAGLGTVPIQLPPHTHYFKNLPLTLLPHAEAVRSVMVEKGINSRSRIAASSVVKNPIACTSSNTWKRYVGRFLAVARAKAVILVPELNPLTEVYQIGEAMCTPTEDGGQIIKMTYGYRHGNNSGTITVTGTTNSSGSLIRGPTAS